MAAHVDSRPPASTRPTGTVTFLFSDIEGSTARWDAYHKEMAAALARHDALMRAALEVHGAYIFKTMGDAFCAAFARASDAVIAALEVQRALAAEDFSAVHGLRVRMALHAGIAHEREGDYFGPALNRVARLLAVGHGGQVLVSGSAAALLQHALPLHSSLRDLGDHRLRDLARPERVYQLLAPDLQEAFPELRSLDHLSNNLPQQLTSLIGRDAVLAEIKTLLTQHHLVTLTGAGGAGKTRCAIQAGADLLDGSSDGVWLAELAPVTDQALVANVIAQAMYVREQPNQPILDTLVAYLKRKQLLIILDNCEHVIDEARHVAATILRECPDVRILATSREPLNISGEAAYRMPSLSPSDAAQLFVDRAHLSNTHFSLTRENAGQVAEICRRLDGIPLAIELASARVKVLTPRQLLEKLNERFRVLTGGDRNALPRHQTMRALIDWSYELLTNDERALFRKLSVFSGGFTLQTAAAVCNEGDRDEFAVLDLLTSLVDKSLIQADPGDDETRYRLLESTRQYAREKLSNARETDAAAHMHARAFLALAQQLDDAWEAMPDRAWFARAEPEIENLRAALTWAFGSGGDLPLGQRLIGSMCLIWQYLATAEGLRWVRRAQESCTADTPIDVLARLDLTESFLTAVLGQHTSSLAAAERALARFNAVDDALHVALAEHRVGFSLVAAGKNAEGEALLRDALAKFRALGTRKAESFALDRLAWVRSLDGDIDVARALHGEALATARAAGGEQQAAWIALNFAEMEFRAGDAVSALRFADEALTVFRAFDDNRSVTNVLCNVAAYLIALQRYDEACVSACEALAVARDAQHSVGVAFTLQHLAAIAALHSEVWSQASDDRSRAARILGFVDARIASLEALREYTEQHEYDAVIPLLRDALGEDALANLMAEGSAWSEDRAIAEVAPRREGTKTTARK